MALNVVGKYHERSKSAEKNVKGFITLSFKIVIRHCFFTKRLWRKNSDKMQIV
jgi:hypothetical protein